MAMIASMESPILAAGNGEAEVIGALNDGDAFDVLEITTSYCWGRQQGDGGVVGYVVREAFEQAAEKAA